MNNLDFLNDDNYIPKSSGESPQTYASGGSPARGIRNCNPLNIRYNAHNDWVGKYPRENNNDGVFEQFHFMWQGFLAAFKLIGNTYIYRYRLNTLAAIINRWCPKGDADNDPDAYLKKVCAWTGVGGQEPLSNTDPRLKNIVMAMAVVESGAEIKHYKADLDRAFEEYKPIKAELRGAPKRYY